VSVCVFVLVWSIERFTVLEVVQGLVEQHEVDSDLRDRLKEKEAEVAYLKFIRSRDSTEADTGSSSLPINTHTALDGPDTDETPCLWLQSNGGRIERGV
jgi:hypothetical protein